MKIIDNSYVKHLNAKGAEYIEGWDNHFVGALNDQNHKFSAQFTNSFGNESKIKGDWRNYKFIYLFWGMAYGYDNHPDGVSYAGIGFKFRGQIRMLMPGIGKGFNRAWLSIRADVKEYPDG